ncbi:MAG: hypothetical protein KGH64_05660, partial [Candidatus Micrarchaeota archaeon]|nr:hypothetical protein [Candidatus Micrarchaeota archaeon]
MRINAILLSAVFLCFACGNSFAYINATYLNTTVILNATTTAHVIETVTINMSNSSVAQYLQDRQAINLTLSDWASTLHTNLLIQHILSPNSSVGRFTLLPGPLLYSNSRTAQATLTMSYIDYNITSITNIGPRRFEYIFNGGSLNFEHTAGGQSLPPDARLNIIV